MPIYLIYLQHHIRTGCLCSEDRDEIGEHALLLEELSHTYVDSRYEGDQYSMKVEDMTTQCWVDKRKEPWCLLPEEALRQCIMASNRPLWVCDRPAKEIADVPYSSQFTSRERLALLSQIDKLSNAIGGCKRIHQTAVPLNYARHSLRSLTVWLFSLPFVLLKDLGLLTGVVMAVISWVLFGVYKIGYSIEDPFQGTLRLSKLCEEIKKDVLADEERRTSAFCLHNYRQDERMKHYQ